MLVKSKYNCDNFIFYIKQFDMIIKYIHLLHNYNQYNLIITDETEEDIKNINDNLLRNKKNPEFNRDNLKFICSNDIQINWCEKYNFTFETNQPNINFDDCFIPKNIEKPQWAFKDHTLFLEYYKDANINIIHIEGLAHHWNIIPYLQNNTYTFVTWPCYFGKWLYEHEVNTLNTLNKNYPRNQIIFLSPDIDGILWAHEYGFNAILCNHNCFIDYNKFTTIEMTKEYDMVMNCRPELWKRPYLAEKINELAYIKGATYESNEKYDFTKLTCKFMNDKLISMNNVIDVYNKSFCGGIFSEKEGACYSSSEYLLCGLPVISTLSRGGRDTWYTQTNSIICQDNADDVKKCVELCIKLCNNGTFNRNKIRNDHIQLSNEMRNNFIQYTKIIFIENGIDMNADDYFNKMYFHKMKNYIKSEIIINSYLN